LKEDHSNDGWQSAVVGVSMVKINNQHCASLISEEKKKIIIIDLSIKILFLIIIIEIKILIEYLLSINFHSPLTSRPSP